MKRKSIDMLRLRPGATVLDVGCGLGRDAEAILSDVGSTGRVVGIDTSRDLISKAIDGRKRISVGLSSKWEMLSRSISPTTCSMRAV